MNAGEIDGDIALALAGDAHALERVLAHTQPLVFNLAMRMLGRREDALDATQEILLRVLTHLSQFRGESRFTTWVYRLAANALLDELGSAQRRRERSFSDIASDLDRGMDLAQALPQAVDPVTPEQRLAATELALVCTQGMLLALQGPQRLAYVIGEVMGFDGVEGAAIVDVSPAAFRQQLARAREAVRAFVGGHCGLVSKAARCRCTAQLRAADERTVAWLQRQPVSAGAPAPLLHDAVARLGVDEVRRLRSAAQLFRAQPNHLADEELRHRLRRLIESSVFASRSTH